MAATLMLMGLIKDQVLKALSSALNTELTCDELDVSPLRGAVQVTNLRIASSAGDRPLVTIARANGKLSMAKALGGTIAISELNVEGLRIHIARDAAGEWNFPKKRISFSKPEPATKPATAPAKKRTIEIEKALIVDAAIHFVHALKDGPPYELLATPIMANLSKRAGGYDLTLIVQDVKRPDTGDSLGSCNIAIKLNGVTDLMQVMEAAVSLTAELDTRASAKVTAPSIGGGPYAFDAKADVDLATLKSAAPAVLLQRVPNVTGNITMDAVGAFDRKTGVKLEGASIRVGPSELIFE